VLCCVVLCCVVLCLVKWCVAIVAFFGFSRIFLLGILKGSLRDVFISRSALKS
jgi:hypothetical protein